MSKQCMCCGKEIPDNEYNFICDFCKSQQMRLEEDIQKRVRYAYDNGRVAGAMMAVKEVLTQVKTLIAKADVIVDENNHCWQADTGYNKEQIDNGFIELCKLYKVEV